MRITILQCDVCTGKEGVKEYPRWKHRACAEDDNYGQIDLCQKCACKMLELTLGQIRQDDVVNKAIIKIQQQHTNKKLGRS